MFFNVKTKRTS